MSTTGCRNPSSATYLYAHSNFSNMKNLNHRASREWRLLTLAMHHVGLACSGGNQSRLAGCKP